jgi:hypothetical protein
VRARGLQAVSGSAEIGAWWLCAVCGGNDELPTMRGNRRASRPRSD